MTNKQLNEVVETPTLSLQGMSQEGRAGIDDQPQPRSAGLADRSALTLWKSVTR